MPNTFGTAYQQFPLIDPRCVREHRTRFRRDLFPELDRANSYYSMAGRWPDVGWLLVDRNTLNQFNIYTNNFQLIIGDFVNNPITLPDLSIVQARCVTRGIASDPSAIYLVQVTNNQGVLYNPWFQLPINSQYNVRSPAYDGSYYSGSLNGGIPWTWSGMVGDIWRQTGTLLGAYPGLPMNPFGLPEGFILVGVPLWEALNQIMDYLGMSISGSSPNFTIVVPGAADNMFQTQLSTYSKYLEDSMEYLDEGSGRVPSSVTVYFHRRNQVYGTEETVRNDLPQWENATAYSVSVPAPATFSGAVGVGHLWSDFTVRYDQNGLPLAVDVITANLIAIERVQNYYNTIYRGTSGFLRHVYSGALPFQTGSMVDGVRWFNTGMLGTSEDKYCGWRTEIIRGYLWEEVQFSPTGLGLTGRG